MFGFQSPDIHMLRQHV